MSSEHERRAFQQIPPASWLTESVIAPLSRCYEMVASIPDCDVSMLRPAFRAWKAAQRVESMAVAMQNDPGLVSIAAEQKGEKNSIYAGPNYHPFKGKLSLNSPSYQDIVDSFPWFAVRKFKGQAEVAAGMRDWVPMKGMGRPDDTNSALRMLQEARIIYKAGVRQAIHGVRHHGVKLPGAPSEVIDDVEREVRNQCRRASQGADSGADITRLLGAVALHSPQNRDRSFKLSGRKLR